MSARLALLALLALLTLLGPVWPVGVTAVAAAEASQIEAALALVNAERARVGVRPVTTHPALMRAASNHVAYYQANFGDPDLAGLGLHLEKPGRPGFTGVDPEARALAAGYPGHIINENAGVTGSLEASLRWHFSVVYHRLPLLDPRYEHIGFAAISQGRIKFDIVVVGTSRWPATAEPAWIAWPPAEATDVGLSFNGEAPNPFPGRRYPIGFPITLSYHGPGTIAFSGATLRDAAGVALPLIFFQGSGWHSRRTAILAATAPLSRSSRYSVEVRGTLDGRPFARGWQFTTMGATTPPARPIVPPSPPPSTDPPAPSPTPTSPPPTPTATTPPAPSPAPTSPPAPAPPPPTSTPAPPASPIERPVPPPPPMALPPGLMRADEAVVALWQRSDGSTAAGRTGGWLWGPDTFATHRERYHEAPDSRRTVHYFDKGRMEITNPRARRDTGWYVTSGLLARELVTGQVQVGDGRWESQQPAALPVVGDLQENALAPRYTTFAPFVSRTADDNRAEPQIGAPITTTLSGDGQLGRNARLGALASVGAYHEALGHNIPAVFWDWLGALEPGWEYVLGYPISEPFWVKTLVNSVEYDVLVQIFERRVLTYTPENPPEWRVEMGNVGRHYSLWRYGQ